LLIFPVWQSAIALYLADKHPHADLGHRIEDLLTPLAYSGVVEPAFTSKFLRFTVPRGSAGWFDSNEVMDFINTRLATHPYIVGEKFTAADVLYAGAFALFMDSPMLEGEKIPQLQDYVARCASRPARARMAGRNQPPVVGVA
jgi:glutathione S-transferase